MIKSRNSSPRVFKTAWFAKAARKARIDDRDNISGDELAGFRALTKVYAGLTDRQVEQLLQDKDLMEVCHDE